MTQPKNEVPALIAALGLTAALIAGGAWFLKDSAILGNKQASAPDPQSTEAPQPSPAASPQTDGQAVPTAASTFTEVANVPSGQFSYGGSTTWAPIRGAVDPLIRQALPNFKLVYKDAPAQTPGSSVGIQMLIDGELDFAQSSRPLNADEKQKAQQQGMALQEIPVATEAVAIATHPDLSIPGLTLSQLKDIYTGQITNWNQVGGPNLAIVPASRSDVGGTVQFFEETVLKGQSFASTLKRLSNTTEALRFVGDTPGSIYFASAPEIVGQCTVAPVPIGTSAQQLVPPYQAPYVAPQDCPTRRNQMNLSAFENQTYPLTRPLYVIVAENGQPSQQAGTAYAQLLQTEEAQRLLNQAGFVPLR